MLTRLKLLRLQREMLETRERRMLDPGKRMTESDCKERLMKNGIRGAKFTSSSEGSAKYKGATNPGNNSRDSEIRLYE